MVGEWRAYLYDKSDVFVAELPFESLTITFILNGVWTADARVNYLVLKKWAEKQGTTVSDILTQGFRSVNIQRNEITIFKGILSDASIDKFEQDSNISLSFRGWLAYFEKRFVTKDYATTDAGAIGWDLINTAQAEAYGDIGVTMGTIEATVNRDRSYSNQKVADALIGLSNSQIINGYEFEISNDKVFTVKARMGSDKPAVVFDETNIKSYSLAYLLGLELTNQAIALGEGLGDAQLTSTRDALVAYKSVWYLLQDIISFVTVKEQATLDAHGDQYLADNQALKVQPSIVVIISNIDIDDYDVGDEVKVEIEDLVDGLYRISKKTINVSNTDETVSLEFL